MGVIIGMFNQFARLGVTRAAAFFYAVAVGVVANVVIQHFTPRDRAKAHRAASSDDPRERSSDRAASRRAERGVAGEQRHRNPSAGAYETARARCVGLGESAEPGGDGRAGVAADRVAQRIDDATNRGPTCVRQASDQCRDRR